MHKQDNFLNTIYEHQALIHKICNIYRDRKEDKEDLFQEITYQLWKSFPSFKGNSKITTWMYRIALNTALASFRKGRLPMSESNKFPERPIEEKEENLQKKQLFQAIRKLDEGQKAIISLHATSLKDVIMRRIQISKSVRPKPKPCQGSTHAER